MLYFSECVYLRQVFQAKKLCKNFDTLISNSKYDILKEVTMKIKYLNNIDLCWNASTRLFKSLNIHKFGVDVQNVFSTVVNIKAKIYMKHVYH